MGLFDGASQASQTDQATESPEEAEQATPLGVIPDEDAREDRAEEEVQTPPPEETLQQREEDTSASAADAAVQHHAEAKETAEVPEVSLEPTPQNLEQLPVARPPQQYEYHHNNLRVGHGIYLDVLGIMYMTMYHPSTYLYFMSDQFLNKNPYSPRSGH